MHKLSVLLILLSLAIVALSCVTQPQIQSTPNLDPFNKIRTNGTNKHPVLLRLNNSLGQFYCSGFAIDGQYAMTAAHCLQNNWGNLKHDLIKVSDYDNVYVTDAVPVAIDRDLDVGFIKGNFQDFQTVPVDFTGQHFKDGMLMVSCGFPSGQWQPLCVQLKHVGNHYFQYATTGGPIYHGCSGGPVFEVTSGYIVGVNSAVDEDIVVISPVINALINVGL